MYIRGLVEFAMTSMVERSIGSRFRIASLRSRYNMEFKWVLCGLRTGNLNIRGQVSSYYFKQLAQELVRPIAGVERIVNHRMVNHLEVVDVSNCSREQET